MIITNKEGTTRIFWQDGFPQTVSTEIKVSTVSNNKSWKRVQLIINGVTFINRQCKDDMVLMLSGCQKIVNQLENLIMNEEPDIEFVILPESVDYDMYKKPRRRHYDNI